MKLLKTVPLLLSLAVATAQAADVNPHPQSFGTWHDADGGNFVINKNGFKEFAHVSAECGQKSKGYVHESSWISGKELAKSIRESIEIEDSDNKAYGSEMHAVLKTIRPNKKIPAHRRGTQLQRRHRILHPARQKQRPAQYHRARRIFPPRQTGEINQKAV